MTWDEKVEKLREVMEACAVAEVAHSNALDEAGDAANRARAADMEADVMGEAARVAGNALIAARGAVKDAAAEFAESTGQGGQVSMVGVPGRDGA